MEPPKRIKKQISIKDVKIEWFSISSAYIDTPDYITFSANEKIDTIFRSNNIADIRRLEGDSVLIVFLGSPKKYNKNISVPKNHLEIEIIVDTTAIFNAKNQH